MEHWERLEADALGAWRGGDISRARELMSQAVAESEAAVDGAAMFYFMIEDYDEAVAYFRRGLVRKQEALGPGKELATYMLWLAEALRKSDNGDEAEQVEQASRAIWSGDAV